MASVFESVSTGFHHSYVVVPLLLYRPRFNMVYPNLSGIATVEIPVGPMSMRAVYKDSVN